MKHVSRVVDAELAERLSAAGAVVIEAPRPPATAETVAASAVFLDVDASAREMVYIDPAAVLEGDTPRLVDEWQTTAIWNHIRKAGDRPGIPGQFVLTGSAVAADDVVRHTGAGRLTRLRMRPMSLFKTGESTVAMSLAGLLAGEPQRSAQSNLALRPLAELACAGGGPGTWAATLRKLREATGTTCRRFNAPTFGKQAASGRDPVGRKTASVVGPPRRHARHRRDARQRRSRSRSRPSRPAPPPNTWRRWSGS